LVTSEGTIWKRRFDALDSGYRDRVLKPAIADKKKTSIEVKGKLPANVGETVEKEVVIPERHTVPALAHVSPDIEGPRPSPPHTENQRKFVAEFKKLMESNGKEADAIEKALTEKIFKLTGPQLVECVEAYLEVSLKYDEKDVRSLR